jgi:hypothetical protein
MLTAIYASVFQVIYTLQILWLKLWSSHLPQSHYKPDSIFDFTTLIMSDEITEPLTV